MTDPKDKPVLNEQTFAKLLQSAYVLQEHGRTMRELEARMESHSERLREQEAADQAALAGNKPASKKTSRADSDYTLTLAEIVEAQRTIQARRLDLDKALAVIAEKVARIASATGAGIGLLEEKTVRYRAAAGDPALPAGTGVPLSTAVCAASIRTGQVIRSDDVNTEVLFDPEPCRERGILSLVAVPIYHDGDIVGALELYFDSIHGYAEQDIHTCQLMAGLVTEAIGRDVDSKLKSSMVAERSTMLAAIEKLRPNLTALADDQPAAAKIISASADAATAIACWKCGNQLMAAEQFCGKCGAPRDNNADSSSMQSKLAAAWHRQHPSQEILSTTPRNGNSQLPETPVPVAAHSHQGADADQLEDDPQQALVVPKPALPDNFLHSSADLEEEEDLENNPDRPTVLAKPEDEIVWSSAANARDFLESLSETQSPSALARFWQSRRGDFYLAVAVILVLVVIRWGIWSEHPVTATTHGSTAAAANRRKPPAPDAGVSTFDKLLISLGLAEAPAAPEYKGNPDTQVWIDGRTALYYCPGSDLYQKTAKGRLSSQRDAQLDQFEPADRKPCD